MMAVKFTKSMSPYQAGEIAGFPEAEARRLIRLGVAEEYVVKAVKGPPVDKMVEGAPKNKAMTKSKGQMVRKGK